MKQGKDRIVGVVPARFGSSRFPGKPLVEIGGKPMIQWVVERASRSKRVFRVLVATDDERILACVKGFGGDAVMTPREMPTGTDRVAFVVKDMDVDVVVNIQGDEPLVKPEEVDAVAEILLDDEKAVMGTLVKRITHPDELESPNTAKVVVDESGNALYFSRSPVPFCRDGGDRADWLRNRTYFKHVGIYSYRKDFLLEFARWKPTPLEQIEALEQLRVLEKGYRIKVAETDYEPVCVDTPEDVERIQSRLVDKQVLDEGRR